MVGEFDESPEMHLVAHGLTTHAIRVLPEGGQASGILVSQPGHELGDRVHAPLPLRRRPSGWGPRPRAGSHRFARAGGQLPLDLVARQRHAWHDGRQFVLDATTMSRLTRSVNFFL
jgi:hypothetical protein